MLKSLWQWWMTGLVGPLPGALGRWLRGERRTVRAIDTGDGFEFSAPRRDGWRTLWQDAPDRPIPGSVARRLRAADVVLSLPESAVLRRALSVPPHSSAAAYVRGRLDELSPFPEDETCFDVVSPPGGAEAVLVIARRADVESRLDRLQRRKIPAAGVTAAGLEDTALNLAPSGYPPPRRRDPLGAALVVAGLVACAVAVALPFDRQSRLIEELDAERRRLEETLASAAETRDTLRRLRERAAAIGSRAADTPDAVTLLAAVTRAVPDHSWVRQLIVHDGTLTLHGESRDTADLIAQLEASPVLHGVRYDTAITHDTEQDTDRFKLTASVGAGE